MNRCHCKIFSIVLLGLYLAGALAGCGTSPQIQKPPAYEAIGIAGYYGREFHGRTTASGEPYDMHAMTAAHPSLAFGTLVRVTRLKNGRSVTVRINDRGPFVRGRIIDLSFAAARKIGMLNAGLSRVRIALAGP